MKAFLKGKVDKDVSYILRAVAIGTAFAVTSVGLALVSVTGIAGEGGRDECCCERLYRIIELSEPVDFRKGESYTDREARRLAQLVQREQEITSACLDLDERFPERPRLGACADVLGKREDDEDDD